MIEKEVGYYFDQLVKNDDILRQFQNDLGLKLIARDLEYKIDYTYQKLKKDVQELYNPKEELSLLAFLMYKVGYGRFKKPLQIKTKVKNLDDEVASIYKGMRFTDGIDVYYSDTSLNLNHNEEGYILLTNKIVYRQEYVVENCSLIYHINTNTHYKDFVEAKIRRGDDELKYSQNFIDWDADFSYEIDDEFNISIAIVLNNQYGRNIVIGDVLDVEIITTKDTKALPEELTPIDIEYELVLDEFSIEQNYIPPMSIQEMRDMIRFGRKNIGDLVLNEDFRQFLIKNIGNFQAIKVWQEKEENEENGYNITNINKIFVSYISDDNVDEKIIQTIEKAVYGRPVVIRPSQIIDVNVNIIIKTLQSVSNELQRTIKNNVVGYYDNIHKILSKEKLYTIVFQELQQEIDDFALDIQVSNMGVYKNNVFYQILSENVAIQVI